MFGGEGVHLFAFVMVVGVIVGTYSSIYIASPLLLIFGEGKKPSSVRERQPQPAGVTVEASANSPQPQEGRQASGRTFFFSHVHRCRRACDWQNITRHATAHKMRRHPRRPAAQERQTR